jgi:ankyrin repeat protein
MHESRKYSTLAFCAFKNHTHCFKAILEHGKKYNVPLDKRPNDEVFAEWANEPTDEQFTALHFATYHANFHLIRILVEEMGCDINLRNVYGANVLHIAAQGDAPTPLYYFIYLKQMSM